MTLTSEFLRRMRAGALASAAALVLLGGTALAQGVQGYGDGQNGGSSTYQGRGTNGASDVDGSGPGGPRTKPLEAPYNNGATNPGVATVPPPGTPANPRDRPYGSPQGTQNPNEYPPAR